MQPAPSKMSTGQQFARRCYTVLNVGLQKDDMSSMSVVKMRMLRWFCGHTRRDRVRNEVIRDRVGVAPIEEKLTQDRLRWFVHVQRRPPEALMRNGVLERVDNVKRGWIKVE